MEEGGGLLWNKLFTASRRRTGKPKYHVNQNTTSTKGLFIRWSIPGGGVTHTSHKRHSMNAMSHFNTSYKEKKKAADGFTVFPVLF